MTPDNHRPQRCFFLFALSHYLYVAGMGTGGWGLSVCIGACVLLLGGCGNDTLAPGDGTPPSTGGAGGKEQPAATSAGGGGAGGTVAGTGGNASTSSGGGQGGSGGEDAGCAEIDAVLWSFLEASSGTYARYGTYISPNQEGAEDDVMELQLVGPTAGTAGAFDFSEPPDNNGLTCERCLFAGVDPTTLRLFYPASGTLTIDPSSSAMTGRLVGTMTDVTLIEVTVDEATFETTPVPGGKCMHMTVSELDAGAPPGWTCPAEYYHALDGCDCGCGVLDSDCAGHTSASCNWCPAGSCANDGSDFGCQESFLDTGDNAHCICSCEGVECGDNGCGESCGTCSLPETCDGQGQCTCTPDCTGLECGSDGCFGNCGMCGGSDVCVGGSCCTPDCNGKECGDNGCGGSCGACAANELCTGGECICQPNCAGAVCGSDGCGGSCGSCGGSQVCFTGQCCTPNCAGKECGPNGCGGQCGSCDPGDSCLTNGTCCTNPDNCVLDADCCGNLHCEFFSSKCVTCIPNGSFYETDPLHTCCSGIGFGNQCYACLPTGTQCTSSSQCCSHACAGVCQ